MNQVNEARERDIALSSSKSGMNSFTMPCKPKGTSQRYALCQHVILAIKDKRIGESFADCQECVKAGTCIAVKMMLAERKANKCLFYTTDRGYQVLMEAKRKAEYTDEQVSEVTDEIRETESFKRGWHSLDKKEQEVKAKAKTKSAAKPKSKKTSLNNMDTNIFSGVIDNLQG